MKDKKPDVIKVSDKELNKLVKNLQLSNLKESEKKILLTILETYHWISQMYRAKKLSLNKLKRLFSFKTEKSNEDNKEKSKDDDDKSSPPDLKGGHGEKGKGHGRNGKKDLKGAKKVFYKLEDLSTGDKCPSCLMGKVYSVTPGTHIQFTGENPIQATIHETEKLRCNTCGNYFEAELPEEFKKKYDPSADVAITIQKYALGMAFYRSGKWQNDLGVPLPASTAWERCEALMNSVYPVFDELVKYAANGDLFHGDDTRNKILDLQKEIRLKKEKRVGIYTTGIISKIDDKVINLFFTGREYCGENMKKLLLLRTKESQAIFMSDALAMNLPRGIKVFWAKCLTHARRNFWDYRDEYPGMVGYVLKEFAKIYRADFNAKKLNLTGEERLKYHKKHSEKILNKLRRWGLKKLYLKKVEPNEELGGAFKYLFKHFKELTLFLRMPGVPLDNNIVERLLKTPILNRKNSYFYKSEFGALVGDVMMSLIETCKASRINPRNYLLALHQNKSLVKSEPQNWLPWNFKLNISV